MLRFIAAREKHSAWFQFWTSPVGLLDSATSFSKLLTAFCGRQPPQRRAPHRRDSDSDSVFP